MIQMRHFGLLFILIGLAGVVIGNLQYGEALDVEEDELVNPLNLQYAELIIDMGFALLLIGVAVILFEIAEKMDG